MPVLRAVRNRPTCWHPAILRTREEWLHQVAEIRTLCQKANDNFQTSKSILVFVPRRSKKNPGSPVAVQGVNPEKVDVSRCTLINPPSGR